MVTFIFVKLRDIAQQILEPLPLLYFELHIFDIECTHFTVKLNSGLSDQPFVKVPGAFRGNICNFSGKPGFIAKKGFIVVVIRVKLQIGTVSAY